MNTSLHKKARISRQSPPTPDESGYYSPEAKYMKHLLCKEAIEKGIEKHFTSVEKSVKSLINKKK